MRSVDRVGSAFLRRILLRMKELGISQTDARTDIYAAGVLYNVLLTGEHPSVSIASGKSGRIVRKCTSINPDERFQSATALCAAL